MRIDVTQEDIERGEVNSAVACPIAIAIKRQKELPGLRVDCESVEWEGLTFCLWLPTEATTFIRRFDSKEPISPFSFDLDLPEGV